MHGNEIRARDVEIIGRINSGDHLVNQGVGCGDGNTNGDN